MIPLNIPDRPPFYEGEKAVVVSCDMITAYGHGADVCWKGIMSGRNAVADIDRFSTAAFPSGSAAMVNGLRYLEKDSLVLQMFKKIFDTPSESVPKDSGLILASTKGEIDLLEKSLLTGEGEASECNLNNLLEKVSQLTGITGEAIVISAACASATAAIARAAAMIRRGYKDSMLVAACDSVTEFVYSGFSSLMALDKFPARPFDRSRSGLSLGEAAAYALIMSEARARKEKRRILGEISGWGLSDDANHMTGPSRTGDGLSLAITKAMKTAGADEHDIGFISAHGTGTVYNDAMEIKSFKSVFKMEKKPVYSIKGGLGHTMGAAGLVEMIIALRALKEKTVPPTVNLKDPDDDARGWASGNQRAAGENKYGLLTNAGFSGINAALVVG
ncbi:MAG TPA: beta-ketoacyl synthase [Nitrospiraceae bacterium]|nr:beta-ketoacyl synthase [Nitrospiraceae bacterium]